MDVLKIGVFLGVAVIIRCAALPVDQSAASTNLESSSDIENSSPHPGDFNNNGIHEDESPKQETTSDIEKSSVNETVSDKSQEIRPNFDPSLSEKIDDVLNAEFESDNPGHEDEIKERFFFFGHNKPMKKKPIAINEDDEDVHNDVYFEPIKEPVQKPGIIKPIVDAIKKPIQAVLHKPAEIAQHLLNKPHYVFGDNHPISDVKPSIFIHHIKKPIENNGFNKPVEVGLFNEKPSILDNIKKPIHALLEKPTVLNKPHFVPSIVNPSENVLQDKPSLLDKFKKPTHALLEKPSQIVNSVLNKPHQVLESFHETENDFLNKPVDALLNKPSGIVSSFLHKPHSVNKPAHEVENVFNEEPSIFNDIKKPVEAILNKPAEIVGSILNKPHSSPEFVQEFENHKPSVFDNIKEPINALLNKPSQLVSIILNKPQHENEFSGHLANSWNEKPNIFTNIKEPVNALLNKPSQIVGTILNNPPDGNEFSHNLADSWNEKPNIIDNIRRPIQSLLNKPSEQYNPELENIYETPNKVKPVLDGIKKPFEAILNYPAKITSHISHKIPFFDAISHHAIHKPSVPILDDIKKPINAALHKPSRLNLHSSMHFPFEDDFFQNPYEYAFQEANKPSKLSFADIPEVTGHKDYSIPWYQPSNTNVLPGFGFYMDTDRPSWTHNWDSSLRPQFLDYPQVSRPPNQHFNPFYRDLVPHESEFLGRYAPNYPYTSEYMFN